MKKAQAAALPPANDKESQAKSQQAAKMSAAKPGEFDRAGFIAAVKKAIDAAAPKTLEEADSFSSSGKAGQVKGQVLGQVTAGKAAAAGDIKQTTAAPPDESQAKEKPVTPLAPEAAPPAPGDPGAAKAMPDAAPPEQTNLSSGPAEVSNTMASEGVTEQQLKESNEPEFQGALASKKTLEDHSAKAPAQFRQEEKGILGGAKAGAAGSAKAGVAAMTHAKAGSNTKAAAEKESAKAKDEADRKALATKIDGIFDATKKETEAILTGIDEKVTSTFAAGESEARAAFEASQKADMDAYKAKRYSGLGGAALWLKDKIMSLPAEVNQFYDKAKAIYVAKMDDVIGKVADLVGGELTKARDRIARGRTEIDAEVAAAPANIRKFALEKQQSIGAQFDQLEQDVDAKQDAVVEDLAAKYVEARNGIDERIKALQEENKGFKDMAVDAVKGVVGTIKKLKDMLLGVLAKAAGAIDRIISKPIEFLGNLVNAVKTGLNNFVSNIAEHLKGALQQWLFGALGDAGIELPKSFDIKGILHLIFQILGLTWTNIRARIVKGLGKAGEAIMTKIEQGVEVIKIVVAEGLPGLWKLIVAKITDLKDQVIGKIKDFVITKIVIAGITWLISLLNPASAFVKACKMIYDVVMFFVEKGEAIMEFVNTVLDSIGAIASGAISGAASAIEGVLKKILPLALGFLASLLGLGGISDKIKSILEAVQKPVNKVLDSIIGTAVKYGKRMFRRGLAFVKGKAKQVKAWGKKQAGRAQESVKSRWKPISQPVNMNGASHTLHLSPGPPVKLEMASARAELVYTIDGELRRCARLKPKPEKRMAHLRDLRKDAVAIAGLPEETDAERAHVQKRMATLANDLDAYGKAYHAQDVRPADVQLPPGDPMTTAVRRGIDPDKLEFDLVDSSGKPVIDRPGRPPRTGRGKRGREEFSPAQPEHATALSVARGGQVHHAIELQVLDRYPGVFSKEKLNSRLNMRGIPPELDGKRQLHNSKIREIWDTTYARMNREMTARRLQRGTAEYQSYVTQNLQSTRNYVDWLVGMFFSENRPRR